MNLFKWKTYCIPQFELKAKNSGIYLLDRHYDYCFQYSTNSRPQCQCNLASYLGLLTTAFVVCSTNVGEGLVKLSHVQWRTWTWN